MRMMVKVSIAGEKGNELIRKGTLGKTMQSILSDVKPEAAYFGTENGMRTAFLFLNLNDASQIPAIAEPFFLAFNATVNFQPVMNAEDVAKAMAGIGPVAQKYA